uniref:Uncharacterized protein n=1 Tax=Arundo donax TaxID=35708 RepID=A0A0A9B103_ARUDO
MFFFYFSQILSSTLTIGIRDTQSWSPTRSVTTISPDFKSGMARWTPNSS